jgi:omega-6 fatty acid desaturase (delta-12 desaturase)
MESLKQHKRAIIRRHAESRNTIALRQVAATLIPLGLLFWAGILSLDISPWLTAAVIVLLMFMMVRVFALMHECGHGSLCRTQTLNRGCGFALGVVAGMPQYVWSQHHAFHHATNGDWDRYRGPLTTPSVSEFDTLTPLQRWLYLGARSLPMAPIGGFVYLIFNPRYNWLRGSVALLSHALRRKLQTPTESFMACAGSFRTRLWKSAREYRHMCWNNLVLLSTWALLCYTLGAGRFFLIYLISVSLAGGAGIVLFTVQHNFEHAYATDSARWDPDAGAMHGTSFLQLPRWLNWFTANIAYHHVHHLSARIPNYRLVQCHDDHAHLFRDVTRVPLSGIAQALRCLIWDSQAQRIISVAEYRRHRATISG